MNLGMDLVNKINGNAPKVIHPLIKALPVKKKIKPRGQAHWVKLPDENGVMEYAAVIARRFKVSITKVKHLHANYEFDEVYKLISTDIRSRNGQRDVYSLPCGKKASADVVGKYYGCSRSTVQRAWFIAKKDSIKAQRSLALRFKTSDLIVSN